MGGGLERKEERGGEEGETSVMAALLSTFAS